MIIAVIGAGRCSKEIADIAKAVGRELARRGVTLVCGGLGGVMEAACHGAKAEGGTTVGILPGTNPHDANPYVDIPIVTGMGGARNVIVVRTGQAVIAVEGGYGTLSEIAHALRMGKPVVGLKTWQLAKAGREVKDIVVASTPREAVEKAIALAGGRN
ncbi:MAG: TIGR00725 family protein [Chloroflexota bacterium]|nr:TIGR00725 family protein [Chloroflexota bacterium]